MSFSYEALPVPIDNLILGDNLTFGLGFEFKISKDEELFYMQSTISYLYKENPSPLLSFSNEIIFKIENINEVVKEEKGEILEINDEFLVTLAGVCIGTTRGLLCAKTKGTDWANFPLPLLNPKDVVEDMNQASS